MSKTICKVKCSVDEYLCSPLQSSTINEIRTELESRLPAVKRFNKRCAIALIITTISFLTAIAVVTFNNIPWQFESSIMKVYPLAHMLLFIIIGIIWSGQSEYFVPSVDELSIVIDGHEYVRSQFGMINQLTSCTIEGKYSHIEEAALLLDKLSRQGRNPVVFEARLIQKIAFDQALSVKPHCS